VCTATGEENSFPANTSEDDIVKSLFDKGLLFNQSIDFSAENSGSDRYNDLFIWSASQGDYPEKPWQVLAAIDITSNPLDAKLMQAYSCSINTHSLDWLLSLIQVNSAIVAWTDIVKGACLRHKTLPIRQLCPRIPVQSLPQA